MRKDLALRPVDFTSSFLSCEKDLETILRRLFVESQPYSNDLKRLLVINTKDCLDNKTSEVYQNAIKDMSLAKLRENGYIKFEPKIKMPEHEEVKSYLAFACDNFKPNDKNPQFRDCNVYIDVLCHTDCWDLGDFRVRPLKICGYIDGILNSLTDKNKHIWNSKGNNIKLSGFGSYDFMACVQGINNEDLSLYTLAYRGTHFTEDNQPLGEVETE